MRAIHQSGKVRQFNDLLNSRLNGYNVSCFKSVTCNVSAPVALDMGAACAPRMSLERRTAVQIQTKRMADEMRVYPAEQAFIPFQIQSNLLEFLLHRTPALLMQIIQCHTSILFAADLRASFQSVQHNCIEIFLGLRERTRCRESPRDVRGIRCVLAPSIEEDA